MFSSSRPPPSLFDGGSSKASSPIDDAPVVPATRGERRFVHVWTAILCVTSLVLLVILMREQRGLVAHAHEPNRDLRPSSVVAAEPMVRVGLYIDRISAFSIVDSTWQPDFYIWFNSQVGELDPGETFQIRDGKILSRTLLKKLDDETHHYALYKVSALITKTFDITRFPRDSQTLMLTIEGVSKAGHPFAFVADKTPPTFSSRVSLPGYQVDKVEGVARATDDEPAFDDRDAARHSPSWQYAAAISLSHPTWRLFFMMFGPAYLAMALAFLGFLLRGAGDRVWISATALSMLLMNTRAIGAMTPSTSVRTLADTLCAIGYVSLTFLVLQSVLATTFFATDARQGAARIFDRSTVVVIAAIYVIMNLGIVMAASV